MKTTPMMDAVIGEPYVEVRARLEREHEIAYGRYSAEELRKAIQDGQVPVIRWMNKAYPVVGEEPGRLFVQREDGPAEVRDGDFDATMGEALVMVGPSAKHILAGVAPVEREEADEIILYTPDLDTWPKDRYEVRQAAVQRMDAMNDLDDAMRPAHPVIVTFAKEDERSKKEKVRAYTTGAQVFILDPTDPVSEILHEIGHVYWWTRLTEDEREGFGALHKQIKARTPVPAIFVDKWGWSTPEEMFATVYLWYIKGQILHPGYGKILAVQFPGACLLLTGVVDRLRRAREAMKAWQENESGVRLWLNKVTGRPTRLAVGGRILKAKTEAKTPAELAFPEGLDHEVLHEYRGRQWVTVRGGALDGETLVLKAGRLDVEYMEEHGEQLHLVPVDRQYVRGDRSAVRTMMMDIGTLLTERGQ